MSVFKILSLTDKTKIRVNDILFFFEYDIVLLIEHFSKSPEELVKTQISVLPAEFLI